METKRKALRLEDKKTKAPRFEYISTAIQDYHTDRLKAYCAAVGRKESIVIDELIMMHRSGLNIAERMSEAIGENHEQYQIKLADMGEQSYFIR